MRRLNFTTPAQLAATAMIGLTGALAPPAAADERPNVMIVLDSSRSMWGQIEGANKVVIAKDGLNKVLDSYKSRLRAGVVVMGTQGTRCKDVKTLLPLGDIDPERYRKALKGPSPRGSTPIALALSRAAKAADYKNKALDIVLIADGADSCQADPCKAAKTLSREAKALRFHVIALSNDNQSELRKLSCLADVGSGSYSPASTRAAFDGALDMVFGKAAHRRSREVAAADSARATDKPDDASKDVDPTPTGSLEPKAPKKPPEPTASTKPAEAKPSAKPKPVAKKPAAEKSAERSASALVPVTFSARLTDKGPAVASGLIWRIYDTKGHGAHRFRLLSTHRDAAPTAALLPGDYLINVSYGRANTTKRISVAPGSKLKEVFILNSGGLRLATVLANGQPISGSAVRYTIFTSERDQFGKRKVIISDAKPGLIIRLNAGEYHIQSVYGDANAIVRANITVHPGKLTEAQVNHSAARVTFKLVSEPGGEALANARWSVLTPGGDVVKESAGALPTHILAAGTYTVLARHGGKNYTRDFTVESGDVRQIEVVIQ